MYALCERYGAAAGEEVEASLGAESFGVLVLEAAIEEVSDTLGNELHSRWHPQHAAPTLPMDLAGAKSVIDRLRNGKAKDGHNTCLKSWDAYWRWDWGRMQGVLDRIGEARNDLNHKPDAPLDPARIVTILQDMMLMYSELELDDSALQGLHTALQGHGMQQTVLVLGEERGGMRIPFRDPRKYLVGCDSQIQAVAAELCTQSYSRIMLHGDSGTGKTVRAIAVAYEVCMCKSFDLNVE